MSTSNVPGGIHAAFVQRQLPDWLKHATTQDLKHLRDTQVGAQYTASGLAPWFTAAPAAQRQALTDAQERLRHATRGLAGLLKHLKTITEFAEPLLTARLKADHGVELDVNTAQFITVTREWHGNGRWQKLTVQRRSLLQAALQNFAAGGLAEEEASLSSDGEYEISNDTVYQPAVLTFKQPLALSAQAFATTCHDLDLGRLYQEHLSTIYDNPLVSSRIRLRAMTVQALLIEVQAHIALMKSEVSAPAHAALITFAQGREEASLNGAPLEALQLSMYGYPLANAWLLRGGAPEGSAEHTIIAWLPGAPLYPLKEYPSLKAFADDLRISLSQADYRALLTSYVARSDQPAFGARLQSHILHQVPTEYDPVFDPQASLKLRHTVVQGNLFRAVQDASRLRLKADARAIAVPSAEVDAQASEARWAYWASAGLNALNVAAFFVPALGPVMALVAAEQVMLDAVDGAVAWHDGDRDTAWAHFQAVATNLAIAAGLGLGLKAVARMPSSTALDELVVIELPNGARRLWRPDITPYATSASLAELAADNEGIYRAGERQYVRIDEQVYPIKQDATGQWRIQASDADAYQPTLRSNGSGAWQADGEQPLSWSRRQLLRRLGPVTDRLDDAELARAADLCGITDDALRRVHADLLPTPPRLADTLRRMRLDHRVSAMIDGVRSGAGRGSDLGFIPPLAVELPRWPGRRIQVFSGPEPWGDSITYGDDLFHEAPLISLTQEQLYAGELPQRVIASLSEAQALIFFGEDVAASERLAVLRVRLADRMQARRTTITDSLYASTASEQTAAVKCLQGQFASLSDAAAQALIDGATSEELVTLQATPPKVPLRLAEQARRLVREQRIDRALHGLIDPLRASVDSDRLALALVDQLPGWTGTLRLELRNARLDGALLESVGAKEDPLKTLVRGEGFHVYDQHDQGLGVARTVFDALLKALSDSERTALGYTITDSERLQRDLFTRATADRAETAARLGVKRAPTWRLPRPNGEIGYRLNGDPASAGAALAGEHTPSLVNRVRGLYPSMDDTAVNALLAELSLGTEPVVEVLARRLADLRQLRIELDDWVARPQELNVPGQLQRPVPARVRRNVADEIERAFRHQTEQVMAGDGTIVGRALNLSGMRLAQLPDITADMSHIASLQMSNMVLTDVPPGFMGAFSRLRWLDLSHNSLIRVPSSLAGLDTLTKLYLRGNRIVLDEAANTLIAGLRRLKVLSLEGNPIGLLPDVSPLPDLIGLLLRRTGINAWPPGVFSRPALEVLDLRANVITHIPDAVLNPAPEQAAMVLRVNRATTLHANPLDADSLQRLQDYRERTGVDLGIVPELMAHHAAPTANPSARWLVGTPAAQVGEREAVWNALVALPGSEDLFTLLNDLHHTAEFQRAYPDLKARVWKLLDAAAASSEFREELFELAAHPETCHDGAIVVFSGFEVRVLVHEAMGMATQAGAERALMELAQGMRRLDEVERIALRTIKQRRSAGRPVDDIEVRLAYRTGLADVLDLPGQPRHMNYRPSAGINQADLNAAGEEVLNGETPEVLKAELASRDFWLNYLRTQYRDKFEAVNAPYHARLEALEVDKQSMTDKQYLDQVGKITQRRTLDETRLAQDLTATLWNEVPAQQTRL